MATTLTSTTFSSTFKDDFTDSAGFHRILFNSGKALQARELTQLQTILQKQIQRFGDNIFKEGAVVKPGGVNLNSQYEFIKLDTTSNTLPPDPSTLVGVSFTGTTSGVIAKVIQVVAATGSDPATLYVHYTNTSSGTSGANTIRMSAGENMTGSGTLTVQSTNTTANPAVGVGVLATILSGVYYARGNFVFTEDQSKIISKYSDNIDVNVGFKAIEDVVSTADDNSLFDNQGAVPNLTAPGADRYRIRLLIATESEIDSDENFIHVATVKEGAIYNAIDTNSAYNIPNDVIAKRIFENSGDYTVRPFNINFALDSESTHLKLNISDGVVVVDGYRASRDFPTSLRVSKPTTTTTIANDVTGVNFGNFVVVDNSDMLDSSQRGLPNINVFEKLDLKDGLDYTGNTIGTARVKAVNEDGTDLNYHLFDIKMNAAKAFRDVKSIGTSTSSYFRPKLESSKAVLKETGNNTSLFPLSRIRPKALTDISFAVQRRFTGTTDGAGNLAISLSAAGETFTNTGDWIASKVDSDVMINATTTSAGTTSNTVGFGSTNASSAVEILAYVNKSLATVKTKTLTTKAVTVSIDSDGFGQKFLPLNKADIFDVSQILKSGDSNVSYANRFELDDGQRDNHYALGRLLLKNNHAAPSGGIFINYRHFAHGVSGDFFAVNSYTGQVDYDKIPKYRFSNGTRVRLRDYLDFRSVMDSAGEFTTSGTGARVVELPQPGTLITADTEYYLGQATKLVINREGIITLVKGAPGFSPVPPAKPDQSLALYNITLNPNTDNDSDVIISKIDHKRFTMKDIAQLEKRVSVVEETTALNLLELDTKHLQVLDSSGNDRTKSGFFVDNFKDHRLSFARVDKGHRASIDPIQGNMRPAFTEDNIRLVYDSAESVTSNSGEHKVIRKGDNVYIAYDEVPYINQNKASKSIQINPFSVVIYEGLLTLSPASDEWRDVERRQDKIIAGGTRLATRNAFNWNNWSWSWGGISVENLSLGSRTNVQSGIVNRVVSEETVLDLIEDKVLQTAFLPFIRSRKVFFKVSGMRPNTQVFPILDGVNISNFARSESSFQFYSDTDSDFGNTLKDLTQHPDGTSTITTNGDGEAIGSFIIPNNPDLKFRCGTRQFKVLDISADNEKDAGCIARATYTATGFLDTKRATYASTRVLNVQGQNIRTYSVYQGGDGGGDDNGSKIKDDTMVVGDWTTGPEGDLPDNIAKSNTHISDMPQYSPYAPDAFYNDDEGDGGGGGEGAGQDNSHVCTAAFHNGLINSFDYKIISKYGLKLRKIDPYMMIGYDIVGPYFAKIVGKNKSGIFLTKYFKAKHQNKKLKLSQKAFELSSKFLLRPMWRLLGRAVMIKKRYTKWQ